MMTAKAAALSSFVALALLVAPASAQLRKASSPSDGPVSLTPRTIQPKFPAEMMTPPDNATGRLIVKFRDECRARCTTEGGVIALSTNTEFKTRMGIARELIAAAGFTLAPALGKTDDQLLALQERAAARSGRAQPDLAGILQLDGPRNNLESLAKVLNAHDSTEWVVYETYPIATAPSAPVFDLDDARDYVAVGSMGTSTDSIETGTPPISEPIGPTIGACCTNAGCFDNQTQNICETPPVNGVFFGGQVCAGITCPPQGACCMGATCTLSFQIVCTVGGGGAYQGDGTTCAPVDPCMPPEDPMCGDAGTGNCFDPDGTGTPYCQSMFCCEYVCTIDETCCDDSDGSPGWDPYCAGIANLNCNFGEGESPCNAAWVAGNCTTPHGETGGCADVACCTTVVGMNAGCATSWGDGCAQLAAMVCANAPGAETTPDFSALQAYADGMGWMAVPSFVQMINGGIAQGWGGSGLPMPQVDMIGDQLIALGVDGLGLGNLSRGKSIDIAVIDIGYHVDHEAVQTVQLEDGVDPSDLNPIVADLERGTAALAMLAAQPDGVGVTGLVYDARVQFYPIALLSTGPRNLSAWTNAVDSLEAGDVIAAPYTVETIPTYNMNNRPDTWTLIRLATDLGINVAVAAGDECADVAVAPDLTDSGGSVCAATTPSSSGFRMPPSNWTTNPVLAASNTIHFNAWGSGVVTAGYGDLHIPMSLDINKTYTTRFGGTAAATMMTAAAMASTQGVAKQFFGIPLPAETIRAILGGATNLPVPDREALNGGFTLANGCTIDIDPSQLNYIGSFPGPVGAVTTMQLDPDIGFDQSPQLQDIVVVRGLQVDGNRFSVKASDNSYLSLSPERTQRTAGGTNRNGVGSGNFMGTNVPEVASINYLATGLITDIVAVGKVDDDLDIVNTLIFESEVSWPNVFTILVVEAYDFRAQRWSFVDILTSTTGGGGDDTNEHMAFGTPRFMRLSDRRILARFYTIGFPSISPQGGDTSYRMRYDFINIFASDLPGEQLP